jgi:hypothetical protein
VYSPSSREQGVDWRRFSEASDSYDASAKRR